VRQIELLDYFWVNRNLFGWWFRALCLWRSFEWSSFCLYLF